MTGVLLRQVRLGSGGPVTDVRIVGGRVTAIGDLRPESGEEVLHHPEATVVPGLIDGHLHAVQWAKSRRRIDVKGARSPVEAIDLVRAALRDRPAPSSGEVVMAHGYRDALWSEPPHKDLLETALPGVPVALISMDLHAIWLSPAALAVVGRDHPTGVLREQECMDVIRVLSDDVPDHLTDRWVLEGAAAAAARGITSVIDFEYADNRRAWLRRAETGPLPVRVQASVWRPWLEESVELGLRTGDLVDEPEAGSGSSAHSGRSGAGTLGRLTMGPFKLLADGSLNTRTAYCHDPYPEADGAERHGLLLIDEEELVTLMTVASSNGLLPAVHAIGDHANTVVLNAFQRVGCAGRIEHAQLVRPADLPRFAALGVVASVQPQHAMSDRDVADHHWAGTTAAAFPYRSLLRAGAVLEFGSDAPVSDADPWQAVADAVHRTDDDRPPWHAEEAMPLPAALTAATAGRTTLTTGDRADLALLAGDPAHQSNHDLRTLPVLATLLDGQFTHRADT